jgi:hypothetical protein
LTLNKEKIQKENKIIKNINYISNKGDYIKKGDILLEIELG